MDMPMKKGEGGVAMASAPPHILSITFFFYLSYI
jgi:hypothetical protein